MTAQLDSTVNTIRGRNSVGHATKDDVLLLFEHIDALEVLLDEADMDDVFGPEGWRHRLDIDNE